MVASFAICSSTSSACTAARRPPPDPALYGTHDSADARRLTLYNHASRSAREPVRRSRSARRRSVRAGARSPAYFLEHPWGRFDFQPAGDELAAWLARDATNPPWLAEVARLEWSKVGAARLPAASDVGTGSLRLAPGVALHRLAYDSARWMIQTERPAEPVVWAGAAVTWRSLMATGRSRAARCDAARDAVVFATAHSTSTAARRTRQDRAIVRELVAAGIVIGDPSEIRRPQAALPDTLVLLFTYVLAGGSPVVSAPSARGVRR
jgi:hypothetical protein